MKKEIELPPKTGDLKKDARGLPVPFTVLWDRAGKPHFKANDERKTEKCIAERLCIICGNRLRKDMYLIGGPVSAFNPNGVFNDAPVHRLCGQFALQYCPYLVNTKYPTTPNYKSLIGAPFPAENKIFFNPTQSGDRVPFFVFAKISDYTVTRRGIERYINPVKPYLEIEFWNGGKQITESEAIELAKSKHPGE